MVASDTAPDCAELGSPYFVCSPVNEAHTLAKVELSVLLVLDVLNLEKRGVLMLVAKPSLETHHHALDIQPVQKQDEKGHKTNTAWKGRKYTRLKRNEHLSTLARHHSAGRGMQSLQPDLQRAELLTTRICTEASAVLLTAVVCSDSPTNLHVWYCQAWSDRLANISRHRPTTCVSHTLRCHNKSLTALMLARLEDLLQEARRAH